MNYQFTIRFSEGHIKYACRKFFARYIGIGFPIIWLLMMVFLVARMSSGKMDMVVGIYLAVLIGSLLIFAFAYFQRCSYLLSQFRKTGNLVNYELSDEFFKAKSNLGSTELKWEAFKAIWAFPKVWLLMFDKAGYLTLPTDQIDNEIKEFLKRKIISVVGKIK